MPLSNFFSPLCNVPAQNHLDTHGDYLFDQHNIAEQSVYFVNLFCMLFYDRSVAVFLTLFNIRENFLVFLVRWRERIYIAEIRTSQRYDGYCCRDAANTPYNYW